MVEVNRMKLYWLTRVGKADYDEADGFIVASKSPRSARKVAAQNAGDEGGDFWRHSAEVLVQQIARQSVFAEEQLVLRDFNAG